MNGDFGRARESFAHSVIGRVLALLKRIATAAWRTSATGRSARSLISRLQALPRPAWIANLSVALAVAASVQPLLISLMPSTVAPAIPWQGYAIVAALAAAAPWQAEAIATAWPKSRLADWIRR